MIAVRSTKSLLVFQITHKEIVIGDRRPKDIKNCVRLRWGGLSLCFHYLAEVEREIYIQKRSLDSIHIMCDINSGVPFSWDVELLTESKIDVTTTALAEKGGEEEKKEEFFTLFVLCYYWHPLNINTHS